MGFRFFRRQKSDGVATDAFEEPGISEANHAAFNHIVDRARQLFGTAAETDSIVVGSGSIPVVSVGALSVIGEDYGGRCHGKATAKPHRAGPPVGIVRDPEDTLILENILELVGGRIAVGRAH